MQPDLLAAAGCAGRCGGAGAAARARGGRGAVRDDWHLETEPADRAKLLATWRSLAPLLRRFDPAATFPEVLNEPVFAGDPAAWARLQHRGRAGDPRHACPTNTIVLTGADWGSIAASCRCRRKPIRNVIYSFHLYEPAELTALGAYRPGLDAGCDGAPAVSRRGSGGLPGHRRLRRAIRRRPT